MEKLTVRDYAKEKGVSTSTVYKQIKDGKIEHKIEDGKIVIVQQKELSNNFEVLEFKREVSSIETRELEILRKRVLELESHVQLFDRVVQENIELRNENRDLRNLIPLKKENDQNEEVEISQYLIGLGFAKKERKAIVSNIKKLPQEERFSYKNGNLFLKPNLFDYSDIY
jgi:hypothetical protein